MAPPDIVILGGRAEGWHGAAAAAGAGAASAVASHGSTSPHCSFAIGGAARYGWARSTRLPRAVLVRSIPAGSFEQVTLRLGLLHALEAMGVAVVNTARAIERCVDKSTTSFLLARAGLPTPPTWVVEQPDAARLLVEQAAARGERLVLKPLFGAQGRGPAPAARSGRAAGRRRRSAASTTCSASCAVTRMAGATSASSSSAAPPWRRWRDAASDWITNVGQGGIPEPCPRRGAAGGAGRGCGRCSRRRPRGRRPDRGRAMAGCRSSRSTACRPGRGCRACARVDIAAELAAYLARPGAPA